MSEKLNAKSDNVIEVKNLYKVYRVGENKIRALNGVGFSIKRGQFCACRNETSIASNFICISI